MVITNASKLIALEAKLDEEKERFLDLQDELDDAEDYIKILEAKLAYTPWWKRLFK